MAADMFMGMPVVVSEDCEPGQTVVVRVRRNGKSERTVVMHPTLVYAFRLVRDDLSRHVGDPSVMIEASVQWQCDRIDRAAYEAVERLDYLMHQHARRRRQRELDAEVARRLQRAQTFIHHGRQHRWTRDALRRTATCHGCTLSITEEQAERLGVKLGNEYERPRGTLSILLDDEWHEVRGMSGLTFNREDGAR